MFDAFVWAERVINSPHEIWRQENSGTTLSYCAKHNQILILIVEPFRRGKPHITSVADGGQTELRRAATALSIDSR